MNSKRQVLPGERAGKSGVVVRPKAEARAARVAQRRPSEVARGAAINAGALTAGGVLQLQRAFGNRAVGRWLAAGGGFGAGAGSRQAAQLKAVTQRQAELDEDEEKMQMKRADAAASGGGAARPAASDVVQRVENRTGLPENLKAGVESLSGVGLDDVAVHYNSARPAQLGAAAYTQGTDIHVAPGEERHLAHEAWHVVQQKQGRVRATMQLKGEAVNDDAALEREADVMGERALAAGAGALREDAGRAAARGGVHAPGSSSHVIQGYDMTYGPLNNGSGTDMHVLIYGKNDPDLGDGGPPSVVPPWWPTPTNEPSAAVRNYFSKFVVQGHLLNNQLGGPGDDMQNLTPITRSTNTTHFTNVEREVKREVLTNNMWVEYRVRAFYNTHPNAVDFGDGVPPGVGKYLNYMAGEIGADYDVYDPVTKNRVRGMPGEKLIKNEGRKMKGTF